MHFLPWDSPDLSDKEDNYMAENNMDVLTANRTYKSRIFAMLFSDRNELLKLWS